MTRLRLPSIDDRCSAEWLAARERQKLLLRCTCRATSLIRTLPALEDLLTVAGARPTIDAVTGYERPGYPLRITFSVRMPADITRPERDHVRRLALALTAKWTKGYYVFGNALQEIWTGLINPTQFKIYDWDEDPYGDFVYLTFISRAYAGMRIPTGCSVRRETTTREALAIACQRH